MKSRPILLGVLNVTPDSFSDGGRYSEASAALRRAESLHAQGADYIDVGGESTRPGAGEVSVAEELERVIPVIERIRKSCPVAISIDTRRFEVAAEAVKQGATLVNDVSGGQDVRMASLGQNGDVGFLLMHMQGTPRTMQLNPSYPGGVVEEVKTFLADRVTRFREAGVPQKSLWIDPGFGFGKTLEHNLSLLRRLGDFDGIAGRLAIGTSRKSFLARAVGQPELPPEERESAAIATCLWAFGAGASVFRVHDVASLRRALLTWEAVRNAG